MKKDIEINYKNKKKYPISKYPIRQPIYLTWLIWFLSKIMTIRQKKKIETIDMDGLKPPYIILSNHMSFLDFELLALKTFPHRVNNVVNIDGFYKRAWLLNWIGAIPTRKFTSDMFLIKKIYKVLARGDVLCMYPEARYSPCGITSFIPDTIGALIKKCNVPVVCVLHRGNHLNSPFWNFRKKRRVPVHTTIKLTLTKDDIKKLTSVEINAIIKNALTYDEYKYQKDSGILIKEKYRAEGLHRILYKCPNCGSEHNMESSGTVLLCNNCNKKWNLEEDGSLKSLDGKTEYSHIPDWFNWERSEVEKEILNGNYFYEDEVDVYSLPRTNKFIKLGKGKIVQNKEDGFILTGHYNDEDYKIIRAPLQINSLHVEYEYFRIKRADCFVINTENDSFFCYPKKENIITKLAFATEIIYQNALKKNKE